MSETHHPLVEFQKIWNIIFNTIQQNNTISVHIIHKLQDFIYIQMEGPKKTNPSNQIYIYNPNSSCELFIHKKNINKQTNKIPSFFAAGD